MEKEIFIKKVREDSHTHELWHRGNRILAAVSGGPDSLALLLVLSILAEKEGLVVGCCTVNHHLRVAASEEVDFVKRVCEERSIPFFAKEIDVPTVLSRGGSLETVARTMRYKALREVAEQEGYDILAVAHHGDDQAETVLQHLIKGSGTTGLSGMKWKNGDIIRPFLGVRRKDIEAFLLDFPYTPCHDETNDVADAERNKIRLQLMPHLQAYNGEIVSALMRLADILREEDTYMEDEADAFIGRYGEETKEGLWIERGPFQAVPLALERRIIRQAFSKVSGKIPSYEGTDRAISLFITGETGQMTSAAGCLLTVFREGAYVTEGNTRSGISYDNNINLMNFKYTDKIKTDIIHNMFSQEGAWGLKQEIYTAPPTHIGKNQLLLDAHKVGHLYVRQAQRGDFFSGKGMSGSKKLNRVMQDLHLSSAERKIWPVVADENHVYWIPFLKVSRFALPEAHTTHYLLVTLIKERMEDNGKSGAGY